MKGNVFLFLLLMFSLTIAASDFKVNGLNFKILSYQEMTVAVEPVELGTTPYSGDIVVPEPDMDCSRIVRKSFRVL